MGYMDKRPSRMQGQACFLKPDGAGKKHGLHPGSEAGVPGVGPSLGQM